MKFKNLSRFQKAILLGVGILIVIASLDVLGYQYHDKLGKGVEYTVSGMGPDYWIFFRNISFMIMLIIPITYYFLVHKDKSESIAIFLSSFIMFWAGLGDILFFILRGNPIPSTLPWLMNSPFIGNISKLIGLETVTSLSLLISVLAGFILVCISSKILEKIN